MSRTGTEPEELGVTRYRSIQERARTLPERTQDERGAAEARILEFVSAVRWQFARTMPHIPHEYTVLKWKPGLHREFLWFARYILEYGRIERWGPYRHSYYSIGHHKYWTMDDPVEETNLINRESTTGTPCGPDRVCQP